MKKSILKLFYTSKLKDKKISKDTDEEEFKEILFFFMVSSWINIRKN